MIDIEIYPSASVQVGKRRFTLAEEQLEYFIMRRAINAISFTLFGVSILIFISALLIPLQRDPASQEKSGKAKVHALSSTLKQAIGESALEQKQSPTVTSELESSIKQFKGAAGFPTQTTPNNNAIDRNRGDSRAMQSLKTSPETSVQRIPDKPPESVSTMDAEDEYFPPQKPINLLVLGDGSFPPGEVKPKAGVQREIDKIIPLIEAHSLSKVIVEGHADKSIPEGFSPAQASKWNKIISMQRAKAIAQVLKQKGVADDRIIVKGLGDTVPLASNLTMKGRSKNRRVEIKLSPAQQ